MAQDEMRIGVSLLHLGNWSGTGFYTGQLIQAVESLADRGIHLVGLTPPGVQPEGKAEIHPVASYRLRWPFRFGAEWLAGCQKLKLDLIHYPVGVGPPRRDIPLVATIHDVSPFLRAECLPPHKAAYLRMAFTAISRVAGVVIADSHWQAEQIASTLDISIQRIRILPPCVSSEFCPGLSSDSGAGCKKNPYFLAVGTLEPRKNIIRLLDAWRMLHSPHDLLLVGRWGWMYESLQTRLSMLGQRHLELDGTEVWEFSEGRRVIHKEYISTSELVACYRSAEGLVYPSLFEGFGLPVLEAMSCGCPVLTSWRSPMEEIAGEAGWYFDPEEEDSIQEAMQTFVKNPDERERRIQIGLARAPLFSLPRFAEGLFTAYRDAAL